MEAQLVGSVAGRVCSSPTARAYDSVVGSHGSLSWSPHASRRIRVVEVRPTTCATCGCRCRSRSSRAGRDPRGRGGGIDDDAPEVLPPAPAAVVPLVPEVVVGPGREAVEPVGSPRATAGADTITPPRFSQSLQPVPSYHLCHMWLSVPGAKQSSRSGPHDATAGCP